MELDIFNNKDALVNKHTFYRAVVEDREDPKKLGRVRVRILGIHPINAKNEGKDKGVPVANLPWAEVIPPLMHGGQNSGIGISTVPVLGTWVWVFLDGGDWNRPIIIGGMYGIPTKQGPGDDKKDGGFFDKDKKYPIKERLNEQDTNRLANQNKFAETPIKKVRDASKDKGIPTATGKTWDEPLEVSSKAKYPDNTVYETIGGNFMEYDDTEGNVRIHFFHKSGTYWEMVENGDYNIKIRKKKFEIIDDDSSKLVKKSEYVTIQADNELKVDGYRDILVGGTHNEIVKGLTTEHYKSGQITKGGPKVKINAGIIQLNC